MTHHAPLLLSDYLTAVKMALADIFDQDVWVVCEIRAVSCKDGHYYFEFADKDSQGKVNATCRGTLWRSAAVAVKKFEQSTHHHLQAGLKILVCGRATFHAQYGFAFNIKDIDPNYTLGGLMQAYQAMKEQLIDNGLLYLNQSLPTPFDIRHVAVIAPQNAAGLGDFRREADRLQACKLCQFDYYYATFQGDNAPSSIQHAIDDVQNTHACYDVVVIIRGGGAVGDLAYLNDYQLAKAVAQMKIPVWVGIGHEKDTVILDEVAHRRFDTPSKVILAIEKHIVQLWQQSQQNYQSICRIIDYAIKTYNQTLNAQMIALKTNSLHRLYHAKQHSAYLLENTKKQSLHQLQYANIKSKQLFDQHQQYKTHLHQKSQQIHHYYQLINSFDPQKTLNKGYAIIRKENKLLTSVHHAKAQETLTIQLSDGIIQVVVC